MHRTRGYLGRMSSPADPNAPAQQRGRFAEFVSGVPLVTLSLLILNIAVYVGGLLGDYGALLSFSAIQPAAVIEGHQFWRIVTCAFVHGGLMHIGMNMLSLFALGTGLENLFGSLQFAFIILLFTFLVGLLYIFLGWLLSVAWDPSYLYSSAVGFSGVLFAMAVDEASLSPLPTRSVFGLFSVPTKVYPWVLMIILQVLLPNVSFLGHLSGVIIGGLHTTGLFNFMVPSLNKCKKLQESRCFASSVGRWNSYKRVPDSDPALLRGRSNSQSIASFFAYVCRPLSDAVGFSRWWAARRSRGEGQDSEQRPTHFSSRGATGESATASQRPGQSPNPLSASSAPSTAVSAPASTSGAAAIPQAAPLSSSSRAALAAAARARALQQQQTKGSSSKSTEGGANPLSPAPTASPAVDGAPLPQLDEEAGTRAGEDEEEESSLLQKAPPQKKAASGRGANGSAV